MFSHTQGLDVAQTLPKLIRPPKEKIEKEHFKLELVKNEGEQPVLKMVLEWTESDDKTAIKLANSTGKSYEEVVQMACEGGCGRKETLRKLAEFGKCDHLICGGCLTDRSSYSTLQCPSCYPAEQNAMRPDELLSVKLIIIENGKKSSQQFEWYGSQSISSTKQMISVMSSRPLSQLLFCSGNLIKKNQLKQIPSDSAELVDLNESGSCITFVAVFN